VETCKTAGFQFLGEESDGTVSVKVPVTDQQVSYLHTHVHLSPVLLKKIS
jgi:hypothetical protein